MDDPISFAAKLVRLSHSDGDMPEHETDDLFRRAGNLIRQQYDELKKVIEERDAALSACEAYIRWEDAEKGNFSHQECVALSIEAERLSRMAITKSPKSNTTTLGCFGGL